MTPAWVSNLSIAYLSFGAACATIIVTVHGFMAIAYFAIFRICFGVTLTTDTLEFWFMMQIAMICGFVTSYPVNWWLIRSGVKAEM